MNCMHVQVQGYQDICMKRICSVSQFNPTLALLSTSNNPINSKFTKIVCIQLMIVILNTFHICTVYLIAKYCLVN